jgi:Kelch motif
MRHRHVWALVALALAGCGSSGSSTRSTKSTKSSATVPGPHRPDRHASVTLRVSRALPALPSARSGIAAAAFGPEIVVIGGLSDAGESTGTVFHVPAHGHAAAGAPLPSPVHDAAAADVGGRLLLFGGGRFEGSDRIVSVLPGSPRDVAALPQPLSDLDAVTIGDVAYVVGGWNGSATNRDIYEAGLSGRVRVVGSFPIGVRYPAAAALGGRVVLAGGELSTGSQTMRAWSFDPASRRVAPIPDLPVATDHAAAAAIDGRVYVIGGLRGGAFTRAILTWAPGESRWRAGGRLPVALADAAAIPFDGGIAVVGGRDSTGRVSNVTLMAPGQS